MRILCSLYHDRTSRLPSRKSLLQVLLAFRIRGNLIRLSMILQLIFPPEFLFAERTAEVTPLKLSVSPSPEKLSKSQEQIKSALPPAVITLGGRASVDDNDGFLDVLAPAIGSDSTFLFLNPKASLGENAVNEENVGLGLRRLVLDEHLIIGVNAFYDSRESSSRFRYDQLGLGVELMTDWVDARANYYLPDQGDRNIVASQETQETSISSETTFSDPFFTKHKIAETGTTVTTTKVTTHHFDQFEQALEGMDFEVGFKIPVISNIAQTRVFGGYYYYNSPFGEDLRGFKARVEVRATPGVILDAEWYEDQELHGSDYYVGVRVRLPFDIGNLLRGKNPFEGSGEYFRRGAQPLKTRMTDMVMRDLDVISEKSKFIENPAKKAVQTTVEENQFNITLLDDITFVDGDNASGRENGTFENPFNTIQEGVSNAFGGKYVYVSDAASSYKENVTLTDSVKLWGSGCVTYGIESGIRPVVDGQSLGPSITMANNTRVQGFEVINTDTGGANQFRTIAGTTYNIKRVGIYAENKTNVEVSCSNLIHANSTGILLAADTVSAFNSTIRDNIIVQNSRGIEIVGQGSSGSFTTNILNNTITGNTGVTGDGINITTTAYDSFSAVITGNTISNNTGMGIGLFPTTNGTTTINITNNTVNSNTDDNMDVSATANDGNINMDVSNNTASSSGGVGIYLGGLVNSGSGAATLNVTNNTISSNTGSNLIVTATSRNSDVTLTVTGNTTNSSSGGAGTVISGIVSGTGSGAITANISNNTVSNNSSSNLTVTLTSLDGGIDVTMTGNTASSSGGAGLILTGAVSGSSNGAIDVNVSNNTVNSNSSTNMTISVTSLNDTITVTADNNTAGSSGGSGIVISGAVSGSTAGAINLDASNNTANSNVSANLAITLTSLDGNINITATGNALSGSSSSTGLSISGNVSGSVAGAINVNASNSVLNSNAGQNAYITLTSLNGDITVTASGNEASDGDSGILITGYVSGSASGGVNVTASNNTVDSNPSANLSLSLNSLNSDINVTVTGNTASNGGGIGVLGIVNGSLSGAVNANVSDNIASNNANNISVTVTSLNNDITLTATGNTANSSTGFYGIQISGQVSGSISGAINANVSSNTANSNTLTNLAVTLTSLNSGITITANNNTASDGAATGISISGSVSGSGSGAGAVNADISGNTASGNGSYNISTALVSRNSDVTLTAAGNTANSALYGINLSGSVSGSGSNIGAVNANVSNNTASNNAFTNLNAVFSSFNNDINITATGNTANSSSSGAGMGVSGIVNGSISGAINADVSNNTVSSNAAGNLYVTLTALNGDITLTASNNTANSGGNQTGIRLLGNVSGSGSGAINATISGNTANDNGYGNSLDNLTVTLTSLNDNLSLTVTGNETNSAGRYGTYLTGVVSGSSGNISALLSGNTTDGSKNSGTALTLTGPDDVTLTLTSNISSSNDFDGIDNYITAGTGSGDALTMYGENNVARNNAKSGILFSLNKSVPTYALDFGGGAVSSPGNNSFTNSGQFDMRDISLLAAGFTIKAENNYWTGGANPPGASLISSSHNAIDANPALSTDPNP